MQDELQPGAHLTTRRRGYVHHGLYAGHGRVIHYAGFSRWFRRGPVEEVTLEQFARGREWQVSTSAAPSFSGQIAVARARGRLGENRYSLWSNNCEHFVAWCLSGTPRSAQVDAIAARARGGVAALGSVLAVRQLRQSH
jgi:Lecithin retinol acyltransferase